MPIHARDLRLGSKLPRQRLCWRRGSPYPPDRGARRIPRGSGGRRPGRFQTAARAPLRRSNFERRGSPSGSVPARRFRMAAPSRLCFPDWRTSPIALKTTAPVACTRHSASGTVHTFTAQPGPWRHWPSPPILAAGQGSPGARFPCQGLPRPFVGLRCQVAKAFRARVSRDVIAVRDEDIDHSPLQREAPIPVQMHRLPLHLAFC